MKLYRKLGRKTLSKLAALVVLGGGTLLPMAVEAAETETTATAAAEESAASETPSYTMGEMVVTATRTEKREIDIPMATEVITAEQIKDSGATNAAEALSQVNGIAFTSFGPGSASMGTMANDFTIRGLKESTLILMNGNPIDMRGKYYLNDISADAIERIEIVKGGGSTLYGSSAMAGVINIITKTDAANSVTVGFGNFGQQKYHLNVGTNGLMVTYDRNRAPYHDEATINSAARGATRTEICDSINQSATISYKMNDHLSFFYGHYDTHSSFNRWVLWSTGAAGAKEGDPFNNRDYITIRDMAQVNYRDKNWKGSLYYNNGTIESRGDTFLSATYARARSYYNTRERHNTYGFDAQRNWKIGKGTLTAGLAGQHEGYNSLPSRSNNTPNDYGRENWGVFAQWDQKIDKKNSFIIGGRETWTTGADNNYSNFSAAGQFLHKMDDTNSLFLNISQSFIMPTFAQMYSTAGGRFIPNPGLKPQKGVNYEIGWKNITGKHTWKASLFLMRVKDNITASYDRPTDTYSFKNEEFQNEGLELSYAVEQTNGLSYNLGLTWQNPKSMESGEDARKPYWDEKFGKIQIVGGVSYKKDKWRASFQGSYLGARSMTPSTAVHTSVTPYFLTTLTVAYAPTKLNEFQLTVNNVFDRHDILTHTSSKYYAAPCNFLFSFTQKW